MPSVLELTNRLCPLSHEVREDVQHQALPQGILHFSRYHGYPEWAKLHIRFKLHVVWANSRKSTSQTLENDLEQIWSKSETWSPWLCHRPKAQIANQKWDRCSSFEMFLSCDQPQGVATKRRGANSPISEAQPAAHPTSIVGGCGCCGASQWVRWSWCLATMLARVVTVAHVLHTAGKGRGRYRGEGCGCTSEDCSSAVLYIYKYIIHFFDGI